MRVTERFGPNDFHGARYPVRPEGGTVARWFE